MDVFSKDGKKARILLVIAGERRLQEIEAKRPPQAVLEPRPTDEGGSAMGGETGTLVSGVEIETGCGILVKREA
jgi:hypothetical protein